VQVGLAGGAPDSARNVHATITAQAKAGGMSGRSRTTFNRRAPQWSIQFGTSVRAGEGHGLLGRAPPSQMLTGHPALRVAG
jgi:hypothetical protein